METEDKLIRLLIVDEGFHKAEKITSSLRAAGVHVRAEFAEDSEDMNEMLQNKSLDLVLFANGLPDFPLSQASGLIEESGRHVALIAMAKKIDSEAIVEAINAGACDAVGADSLEHLRQVVEREAQNIALWRRAKRLETDFQESETRCQNLLSNSKDAVAYVHEGMPIYANQVFLELFGYTDFDDIEGTPIIDMVDASRQDELKNFLRDLSRSGNSSNELELELLQAGGETISARLEFSRATYDGEPCTQILIRSRDETAELEEQINYLHQHDLVTGLYNRQYFMDALKSAIGQAIEGGQQSFVIYVAIDNFQSIRDLVGISGCDTLISDVAEILRDNSGEDVIVARFGASSYACLGRSSEKKATEKLAAKFNHLVEQHISEIGNQSISATCSASIVFIDAKTPDNPNEVISRAERTCDEVQAAGGNNAETYVLRAGEITQDEEDGITADLIKDALNNNRIKGMYQPIVGIKAQQGERYVSSVEITSEDGHILYPRNYQAAAERTGTAKMLDRWKLLHAIKKISDTSKMGRKIEFFIPLSADSLRDPGLAAWAAENISRAGIDGSQLIFLVDESQAVNQLKSVKTLAGGLQELNCRLGIDEFGTGTNPFQLAKLINANFVRINQVYMEDLVHSNDNQESINQLAFQAMDLGISTITPGVTDAAVLSVLWTLNVDFVQGDFLQPPDRELRYDFSSM